MSTPRTAQQGNIVQEAAHLYGGQNKLAKALGLTKQNLSTFKARGYFPECHALEVHRLTRLPLKRLLAVAQEKRLERKASRSE